MNTFGLVHGGGLGAWCWDSVLPELKARGHGVAAVDLSPDDMAAGAVRCAEVVQQAFAGLPNLVLVGHSSVSAQPFASVQIDEFYIEKTPKTHGYMYRGVATK